MLFNSIEFLVFFIIVYFLYWGIFSKKLRLQNILLLISSYIFYGWWDWRFVFLLILSTIIDYSFGLWIHNSNNEHKRKLYLWLSIFNNLAILGVFKYFNFFSESLQEALSFFGWQISPYMLTIALPVGISFYTFHGMSYVFDIYNKRATPVRDFVDYSLFVCFFPLLVAGPIERATHLLPQVIKKRYFNYQQSIHGLRLILWGLFKKIVIADSLAPLVERIFSSSESMSGFSLIIGSISFAFQIYGDFSGYSDIARGLAKLMGFELLINFKFPYFSRDIAEFWRKWHISLSSWFKDYLYIPLGGSKEGTLKSIRNTFIIFLVSGFWHGANWTFIFWGLLHAIYFLPLLLGNRNRRNVGAISPSSALPSFKEVFNIASTFVLVCIAWVFFRANTIGDAYDYLFRIFSNPLLNGQERFLFRGYLYMPIVLLTMFLVEWSSRNEDDINVFFDDVNNKSLRRSLYLLLIFMIIMYGTYEEASFIYFQF